MMGYGRGESLTSFLTLGLFEAAMDGYAQDYVNMTSRTTKMLTDFYVKPWSMVPSVNLTDNSNMSPSPTQETSSGTSDNN